MHIFINNRFLSPFLYACMCVWGTNALFKAQSTRRITFLEIKNLNIHKFTLDSHIKNNKQEKFKTLKWFYKLGQIFLHQKRKPIDLPFTVIRKSIEVTKCNGIVSPFPYFKTLQEVHFCDVFILMTTFLLKVIFIVRVATNLRIRKKNWVVS